MKFFIGGKELEFDEKTKQLKLEDKIMDPAIRTYGNMKELYSSKENLDDSEGLYFMFRGVYLSDYAKDKFAENGMRYDVTVILPKLFGKEFNKTYGHYHPTKANGDRFEEIYEVLGGSALYLQQNGKDVNYTDAFTGDKVVMDEGYGHITINPSDEDILVMANIVDDTFDSEYKEYKELNGGNFYYTTSGFTMNPNYENGLEITEKEDFFEGDDMYDQFLNKPEKFNFLH